MICGFCDKILLLQSFLLNFSNHDIDSRQRKYENRLGGSGGQHAATPHSDGDRWLYGCNKWIAAFPDTADARGGIFAGLSGVNITQDQIEFEQ